MDSKSAAFAKPLWVLTSQQWSVNWRESQTYSGGELRVQQKANVHAIEPRSIARYRDLAFLECTACMEYVLRNGKPLTSQCAHDRVICNDCAARMVESAVTSGGWQIIRCPDRGCKAQLSYEEVQAVASTSDFER